LVSRDAFVSDEVYRLELERIFDRTWMFSAHETEMRESGDYLSRTLGSVPVIVVRDTDGKVHALLNSCRHRRVPGSVAPIPATLGISCAPSTAGPTSRTAG
jgi:phenylpropionate dioxygenase-like ring-hydroxylating dioxygenase large terminal subunit